MAHITGLNVERFKRIEAVRIFLDPKGQLVEVCGDNAQGKSSLLDAIWAALGGAKASPDRPIREGYSSASATLTLSNGLVVEKKWTAKGGSSLVVTDADGNEQRSPQAILSALYNSLTFDPLGFLTKEGKERSKILRQIGGLDFSDLDEKHAKVFAKRTEVNREIKRLKAQVDAAPRHHGVAFVDAAELVKQLHMANETKNANKTKRENVEKAEQAKQVQERTIGDIEREISDLQKELQEEKEKLAQRIMDLNVATELAANLVDPDTTSIEAEIASADETNSKVRDNAAWFSLNSELSINEESASKLTAFLEKIETARATRLASANFPIPGLSVTEDDVTYKGIPLSQASRAEQIKTCLAIAAALNNDLRFIPIHEGSFLDRNNLAVVAEWAEANDYQVLMERVQESPGAGHGVVIVDGMVSKGYGALKGSENLTKGHLAGPKGRESRSAKPTKSKATATSPLQGKNANDELIDILDSGIDMPPPPPPAMPPATEAMDIQEPDFESF